MDECLYFMHPYDLMLCYGEEKLEPQNVMQEVGRLSEKYGIKALRVDIYSQFNLPVSQNGSRFVPQKERASVADDYEMGIMVQEDYNRIENCSVSLSSDKEALIFSSGKDYGYGTVDFYGRKLQVLEELDSFFPEPKAGQNTFGASYLMVVKDKAARDACVKAWADVNGVEDIDGFLASEQQYVQVLLEGPDEGKRAFLSELYEWGQMQPGYTAVREDMEQRENLRVMYGALLFIGILFGLIFFMCLILVMYYKQITEGYEDRDHFVIMRKVGMSDQEIHATVHRQVLMVFGMPLAGAILHTAAGFFMVRGLISTLSLFNTGLLVWCTVGVVAVFVTVYGASYLVTAKTYEKILLV